jgi:hypothetical protein
MKTKLHISAYTILLLTLFGCNNVYKVLYTDKDQSTDFKAFKTFAWLPNNNKENTPYHNQIIDDNTKNFFTHEFFVRGLTLNVDSPDVMLEMVITAKEKQKTEQVANTPPQNQYNNPYANPYRNPYNYNPYSYQATSPQNPYYNPYPNQYNYNNPPTTYTTRIVNYTESTITLNVIDRKSQKLVWTTTVEADLYDPVEMRNNLHPAVHKILNGYPVKPISPKKSKDLSE